MRWRKVQFFPEVARRALHWEALWRPSELLLNVASRTAPACATEDFVVGGGGAVVNGAHRVEPLKKCDGSREVWWGGGGRLFWMLT